MEEYLLQLEPFAKKWGLFVVSEEDIGIQETVTKVEELFVHAFENLKQLQTFIQASQERHFYECRHGLRSACFKRVYFTKSRIKREESIEVILDERRLSYNRNLRNQLAK